MRLIVELCDEHQLTAIINIHDVLLARMFAKRIVGLRHGKIVFDGAPSALNADVLTQIYGAEDWEATIAEAENEGEFAGSG